MSLVPILSLAACPSVTTIMDQLKRKITQLDDHIDKSQASFKVLRDHVDEHIEESRTSFKEIKVNLMTLTACYHPHPRLFWNYMDY